MKSRVFAKDTELKGRVHSIETMGTTDGPGIRFIVFLQGCLFRCKYWHNRDTWDLNGGVEMTVEDILVQLRKYKPFFKASGGGLTVSGGESLLQVPFVTELFKAAQAEGFHTCLDTNGYNKSTEAEIDALLDHTDLVLLDLKQIDNNIHKILVGVSNKRTLAFARHLSDRTQPTWVRYVVVPGYTDDFISVDNLSNFVREMNGVEKVELLPFHKLGSHKWEALGVEDPLAHVEPPSKEAIQALKERLVLDGHSVTV